MSLYAVLALPVFFSEQHRSIFRICSLDVDREYDVDPGRANSDVLAWYTSRNPGDARA
jgi:hypothetical protein